MVAGAGPSARYAHTLALVANRFLVAVGGNDGKQTLSDSWALDTSEKPYQWRKIPESGDDPPPRCVHSQAGAWGSASTARHVCGCVDGRMVVQGVQVACPSSCVRPGPHACMSAERSLEASASAAARPLYPWCMRAR